MKCIYMYTVYDVYTHVHVHVCVCAHVHSRASTPVHTLYIYIETPVCSMPPGMPDDLYTLKDETTTSCAEDRESLQSAGSGSDGIKG